MYLVLKVKEILHKKGIQCLTTIAVKHSMPLRT